MKYLYRMTTKNSLQYKHPSFTGLIGVATEDITPPIRIYSRNWGAAKHDIAEGLHQPLMLGCMTFQSSTKEDPLVLITADLGWWKNSADEWDFRSKLLKALSIDQSRLMFCLAHTHAGPSICRDDASSPGGEFIEQYIDFILNRAILAAQRARSRAIAATLTWHSGKCALAANRDLADPEKDRLVVGFNPEEQADDTLLVGRVTDDQQRTFATIVNYACHPTTLAWNNRLISPDYVGSMRKLVESSTQAPCLFLQGASGDLAPAEQDVEGTKRTESYGRQLGYSVLATLEAMLPPRTQLSLDKVVESVASMAVWARSSYESSPICSAEMIDVALPLKPLPSLSEIEEQWRHCEDRVLKERLWRQRGVRKALGDGDKAKISLWIWRLGDSFLIGQPNEAYSEFQVTLRQDFQAYAIGVMNVVNGHIGYLPPAKFYEREIYSVWQTPYAQGSLELLTRKVKTVLAEMIASTSPTSST